ncbi:ABC transporter permease [Natronomonas salina]|uniref:ABC transporter permease n=1 Tax=Natronomonas salina TaxID=1710540 RepID=UPI0015B6DF0B|nr:ABC transporter permease [Natronomonas salina]QLD89339.1 ABC transporter permease [Natronomonas salina]
MSAFGVGFRSLLKREILRFVRRPKNTFLPPAITNVLYFAVFGVILGQRIDDIAGFDYLLFILPGLVVLGMISNAFENSSFSIFHGRWNEYIHETLTSPLSYTSMVLAYIFAAALRGLVVGVIIVGIGLVFTPVPVERPFYLLSFMTVIPLLFASFGVIGGLVAEDFDHLTVMNQFILRPLVFFGAVFYSLEILDPLYRTLSLLNPMVYMVNGVRYGFLGYQEVDPLVSLGVLSGLTLSVMVLDIYLFKRGYGLID